jgi:hypothetical protein
VFCYEIFKIKKGTDATLDWVIFLLVTRYFDAKISWSGKWGGWGITVSSFSSEKLVSVYSLQEDGSLSIPLRFLVLGEEFEFFFPQDYDLRQFLLVLIRTRIKDQSWVKNLGCW